MNWFWKTYKRKSTTITFHFVHSKLKAPILISWSKFLQRKNYGIEAERGICRKKTSNIRLNIFFLNGLERIFKWRVGFGKLAVLLAHDCFLCWITKFSQKNFSLDPKKENWKSFSEASEWKWIKVFIFMNSCSQVNVTKWSTLNSFSPCNKKIANFNA